MLHEIIPKAKIIAMFVNPNSPFADTQSRNVLAAASAIGQQVHVLYVRTESDFETAFAALIEKRASALVVGSDPFFDGNRDKLIALAARHAMPAIYDRRELAAAGGLVSYGASFADAHRRAGVYVGRILKGANPGELPIQQPTQFALIVNLKTASAMGLSIPRSILVRADEIVQ